MYISSLTKSLTISQSFGKVKLANNIYEMNIADDRASIQGLCDISKSLNINESHMPIMKQFLALSSMNKVDKLPYGYNISATAIPDLQKPERISEKPKDIKAIVEFDPKDSTRILAMHWAPGVTINYSSYSK